MHQAGRRLGQARPGQGGQARPGQPARPPPLQQARPGQGGQARPGQARPGQARPGRHPCNRPGQAMRGPGQARPGQARWGQGGQAKRGQARPRHATPQHPPGHGATPGWGHATQQNTMFPEHHLLGCKLPCPHGQTLHCPAGTVCPTLVATGRPSLQGTPGQTRPGQTRPDQTRPDQALGQAWARPDQAKGGGLAPDVQTSPADQGVQTKGGASPLVPWWAKRSTWMDVFVSP